MVNWIVVVDHKCYNVWSSYVAMVNYLTKIEYLNNSNVYLNNCIDTFKQIKMFI